MSPAQIVAFITSSEEGYFTASMAIHLVINVLLIATFVILLAAPGYSR